MRHGTGPAVILLKVLSVASLVAVLLPPGALAGSLEPPAAPAPTMKTLDEVPPTWSQVLTADDGDAEGCNSSRFTCVLDDQAVLDKETGLVWQRDHGSVLASWSMAHHDCYERAATNRGGYRLPSVSELMSLVDFDRRGPALPIGHPFLNVNGSVNTATSYWTATPHPDSSRGEAYVVQLYGGGIGATPVGQGRHVLCVRGAER